MTMKKMQRKTEKTTTMVSCWTRTRMTRRWFQGTPQARRPSCCRFCHGV